MADKGTSCLPLAGDLSLPSTRVADLSGKSRRPWVWAGAALLSILAFLVGRSVLTTDRMLQLGLEDSSDLTSTELGKGQTDGDENPFEMLKNGRTPTPPLRSELPPDELFRRVSPAVAQVVVRDRHGRIISTGSGFLVSKNGLIATNYHVVAIAHTSTVIFADKTELAVIGAAAFDKVADIAILKVLAPLVNVEPLELVPSDPPVGTKVYAIGNPFGLANTLSDGLLSGYREIDGTRVIQTTAALSSGSSGGALLSVDGRVVGITSSGLSGGQNLNFAVPASLLTNLLLRTQGEGELTRFPLVRQLELDDYVERGLASVKAYRFDEAIKDFDEALRLSPRSSKAYLGRAHALRNQMKIEEAIRDFDAAIRYDQKCEEAYRWRGYSWWLLQDYDKAVKNYNEAINLGAKDSQIYSMRADSLRHKKSYDNAIWDYNEVIRLDPKDIDIYRGRGDTWQEKKEYAKAIKDYEEAIRLDPGHFPGFAYSDLASLLASCPEEEFRDGKRAVQMATKACELTCWKLSIGCQNLNALAAAYAEDGQFEEAVRYQLKVLEDPRYQGPWGDTFRKRLKLYKQKNPYRDYR